jgi:hypothetical protein
VRAIKNKEEEVGKLLSPPRNKMMDIIWMVRAMQARKKKKASPTTKQPTEGQRLDENQR